MKILCWSRFLEGPVARWRQDHMLEQVFWVSFVILWGTHSGVHCTTPEQFMKNYSYWEGEGLIFGSLRRTISHGKNLRLEQKKESYPEEENTVNTINDVW